MKQSNMKVAWIRFIAFLLVFALPIIAVSSVVFLAPSRFDETFLGEFEKKVDRLYETKGEKIVFIGGSSLAFGLDAKLLSETLGKPVINFGLYATLGTKVMMDYARDAIGEGDIIVIAPEMNEQTWSLYFNGESMWQALDGNYDDFRHLSRDNYAAMLGGIWKFAASKAKYFTMELNTDAMGIYQASSFDDYGFIRNNRDQDHNTMDGGAQSGMTIDFSTDMISEEFIDYVNEFTAYAKSRGAKVYLGSCPMNESALAEDLELEDLENYVSYLNEVFDCEVLGDPNNAIYTPGYFFDSNFHLNSAGAVLHTAQFAYALAPLIGLSEEDINIEIPEEPEIPDPDKGIIYDYDPNQEYFTFKVTEKSVFITGLSELGKAQTTLRTPVAYEGRKVTQISADAFAGGSGIKELYVTDNIAWISDGAFRGADSLKKIHILAKADPNANQSDNIPTKVNNNGTPREGLPADSRFYVPKDSLYEYQLNYFWGPFSQYLIGE